MQQLLYFLITVISLIPLRGADISYRFSEQTEQAPNFTDSLRILIDQNGQYSLAEVQLLPEERFVPLGAEQELDFPVVLWAKVQLTNEGKERFDAYFRLYTFIDTIQMYTVQDNQLLDISQSGSAFSPWEKNLSANRTNLPFSLYPGETKTYYFRLRVKEFSCSNRCISTLRVIPRQVLDRSVIVEQSVQSFYVGIMLFFGLVSLFMFSMFREQVFIWFAFMMFSFTAYFSSLNGLTEVLFNYHPALYRTDMVWIISCIIISFTVFVIQYVNLRFLAPKLSRFYLGFAIVVAAFHPLVVLIWGKQLKLLWVADVVTLIWVLVSMFVIVRSVRRSNQASLILLSSVIVLFVGSVLYILTISGLFSPPFWGSYSFQIGTVLFSGTLFYGMFDKINTIRGEKKRYEELDHLKSQFFANISHEFRTPLTLVMGPIQDVLEHTERPEDRHRLQLAYHNAERLLHLINRLLDLSKLEANKMEFRAVEQNIAALLKKIVMSFESLAKRRNIQFHFVAQNEVIPLYVNEGQIEQIFYNLLSNAFKFTPDNGEIAIMVSDYKDRVEILVRDNGVGISAERLPHIFNRFYQGEVSSGNEPHGSGIGLALVKELVQLHRGEIQVESRAGEGTVFRVVFWKGTSHLKSHELESPSRSSNTNSVWKPASVAAPLLVASDAAPSTDDEDAESEEPVVLVIEDNTAVRAYIKQKLVSAFRVVEAVNGQEGIDKAMELLPDLVISDVMMPEKDGYEVCEILKTDERTSHIPIILLTAKAASEEKMKGLLIGADDYLLKPFDTKELAVRAQNLIENRRLLRLKFSSTEEMVPHSEGMSAIDQAFLEKVCSCIDDHIADEQFGVDVLAQEVGLSRSQLNRKLRALTDFSSNKFIQSYRLQKAKEILLSGTGNVTEAAMRTGFNSTAYFVKCFRDKYGQTPGSLLSE